MEDLTIKVAEYEGPMDVLLHLIREMKIDIYDIPMNELTKQYLNFIHSMKTLELEPKLEELDEDGEPIVEDPRDQLVQQLLEYQQIKENAKKLEELSFLRGLHFGKEASDLSSMQEIIPLKEGEVTTQDLWNALKKLARKNIAKMPLKANIQHETHTVEELMDSIISKIEHTDKKQVPFEECFPAFNRHAITTTFLAMLQLVREHRVRFIQSSPYEDILIEKRQEKEKESD